MEQTRTQTWSCLHHIAELEAKLSLMPGQETTLSPSAMSLVNATVSKNLSNYNNRLMDKWREVKGGYWLPYSPELEKVPPLIKDIAGKGLSAIG